MGRGRRGAVRPGRSGGPGGSGGREIGGVNSRIVTIIFETENLFFPARGGHSANHLRNPGAPPPLCVAGGRWSEDGSESSDCKPGAALGQPAPGLRLSRRVCPAGCPGSGSPFGPCSRSPPLCRPCPQVPASLHAPASCSAWRPGAGRGSGTPWSIPGTAGRCPRRGLKSPLRKAWSSPAPMTASLPA